MSAATVAGQVAWSRKRRTALSPALRRSDRQRGITTRVRAALESDPRDPLLQSYFSTLGQLAAEWSEHGALPFRLPVPQSEALRRATRIIVDRLDEALSVTDLAKAVALSERTLRRLGVRFTSSLV